MPALFAYTHLKDRVEKELVEKWDGLLSEIDPKKAYRSPPNNWATVALTGEASQGV